MVIERRSGVQGRQPKQAIGQQLMNFLRGMKHIAIGGDAEVQPGKPIVEDAPVPHERDESENRDEDHQHIEEMMRRERKAAIELANVRRQIRRLVRRPPYKPGDDEGEIDKPDAAMDIDPECARFLRNVVEQETQRSEKHDQRRDGPMKRDGGRI